MFLGNASLQGIRRPSIIDSIFLVSGCNVMFASRSSSTAAGVTGGVAAASNPDGLGPGVVRRWDSASGIGCGVATAVPPWRAPWQEGVPERLLDVCMSVRKLLVSLMITMCLCGIC